MKPPTQLAAYDAGSIFIINPQGFIRRLYTPFRVRCIHPVENIAANTWLYVDEVYPDYKSLLLYKINGGLYPYYHFTITVNF